jgi:cell division protein FtsL
MSGGPGMSDEKYKKLSRFEKIIYWSVVLAWCCISIYMLFFFGK